MYEFKNLEPRIHYTKKQLAKMEENMKTPFWPHVPCNKPECTICARVKRFDEAQAKGMR